MGDDTTRALRQHAQTMLSRAEHLVLAEPPFISLPEGVAAWRHPEPIGGEETTTHGPYGRESRWPQVGLEAVRYPILGYVLSGRAQYRIADWVLELAAGCFFLLPPGVPGPDGSRVHWEGPHPERASCRTLWLVVVPAGVFCQVCRVAEGTHQPETERVFILDSRLFLLADLLLEELRSHPGEAGPLARAYLRAFLLRLRRALVHGPLPLATAPVPADVPDTVAPAVRRAVTFVQENLHRPLSVPRIAAQAAVSRAQLERLFRRDLGTTVFGFVTAARLARARMLLEQTGLPVAEVARLAGYPDPAHFARVFRARTGVTPLEYRHQGTQQAIPSQ